MEIAGLIIGIIGILGSPFVGYFFYNKGVKSQKNDIVNLKNNIETIKHQHTIEIEGLKESLAGYEPIANLDDFTSNVIKSIEEARNNSTVYASFPFPLINAFAERDTFPKRNGWYDMFCKPFLDELRKRKNDGIKLNYLRLADNRTRVIADKIFRDISKVNNYMDELSQFESELEKIFGANRFSKTELYFITHWMFLFTDNNDKHCAMVIFSNPESIATQITEFKPKAIKRFMKGIKISDKGGIDYFEQHFHDLKDKHYLIEMFKEIEERLLGSNIEIAFIKKPDKDNIYKEGQKPIEPSEIHEIVYRMKRNKDDE